MSKRIEKDGNFYRERRGKLVEIPPEWLGRVFYGCSGGKCSYCWTNKLYQKAENAKVQTATKKDIRQQMQEYRDGG